MAHYSGPCIPCCDQCASLATAGSLGGSIVVTFSGVTICTCGNRTPSNAAIQILANPNGAFTLAYTPSGTIPEWSLTISGVATLNLWNGSACTGMPDLTQTGDLVITWTCAPDGSGSRIGISAVFAQGRYPLFDGNPPFNLHAVVANTLTSSSCIISANQGMGYGGTCTLTTP